MDDLEKGLSVYSDFFGEETADARKAGFGGDHFGAPIGEIAMRFAFGAVWARDGLERKQRSLVVMGILIANRQTAELKKHVQIGLRNGLTVREIEEVLVQAIPYAGFPAVATATEAVMAKLKELGIPLDNLERAPAAR